MELNSLKRMIPITKPTLPNYEKIGDKFKEVINSGMITNSKYVKEFENKVANYTNTEESTALSSCTSGLILTQKMLKLKGEVITPSLTFHATTHSLVWNNLTPKFVDIEEEHYCIDPEKVKEAITSKTSAILAVHLFGHPANVKALQEIANDYNLKLIFDAAHAFGSKINGEMIGSFGDAEIFSLSPTKLITTGEGGIVTSKNKELISKLKLARNYGDGGDLNPQFSGLNARLSEFNAILGIETLEYLEKNIQRRNELENLYKRKLSNFGVKFQKISNNVRTTFKDFSIYLNEEITGINRDKLHEKLHEKGIMTRKYFYPPVHKQGAFSSFNELSLQKTEHISSNILSLPLYSHMEENEVEQVCNIFEKVIQENGKR